MGVVFAIVILATIGVYWKSVYIAKTAEIDSTKATIERQRQQNEVYRKKALALPEAEKINRVMDAKLAEEKKYFLPGQEEIVRFFDEWFLDALMNNGIYSAKVEIEPDVTFKISWLMSPMETLPGLADAADMFGWEYIGEGSGSGEVTTLYPNFLEPMTITVTEFTMTYEQMRRFIEELQTDSTYLVTVHAFKNTGDSDNIYGFRTLSVYEIVFTVYFMNPEGAATGDVPAGMPGDMSL
ncbi:MAG: hypothetical protein A2Y63_04925 [Candidatus Riflebacteria bacterium RBG_13_59_9]|nr:MAG: hypothetical protein A2Y63_04925 [Candidatus Riflebacteria bacterium RBG_13_59_9]